MRFEFPSSMFPEFPSIAVEAPDNWSAVTLPVGQLAIAGPTAPGRFRPNVVVTISRLGVEGSLDQASADLRGELATLPEVAWVGERAIDLNGRDGYAAEVAFSDPDAGTLVQTNRVCVVSHDGLVDLVHAVGSCSADEVDESLLTLRSIADSLSVDPPG